MPKRARRATATVSGLMVAGILAASNITATHAAPDETADSTLRLTGFVGVGAALVPDYDGASGDRLIAGPVFDLRYGRLYANLWDGAGVDLLRSDRLEVGAGVTYVRGRKAKYSPEGVNRLKSAVGARGIVRVFLTPEASLTAGVTRSLGGSDGTLADLTFSYRFRPGKQVTLIPTVSAQWASRRYMQGYFGIDALEADRSGLPAFEADSGFKEVSASLTAIYSFTRHIHISGSVSLDRLLDDAADSPLVEQRWQPSVFLGLAYRF